MVPVLGSTALSMKISRPLGRGLLRLGRHHLDRERPFRHVLAHLREVLLRHGEVHVDRPHLVDHQQRIDVVRPHHVACLEQHPADVAVERRADGAVLEIEARVLERGLARPGGRLGGGRVGADLRVGVLGDEVLLEQLLVALLLRARCGRAPRRRASALASAWRSAASYGRGSMRNSTSPFFTAAPSRMFTSVIWPSTRALTCTVENASTLPMALMRTGTVSCSTRATVTGTAAPPCPCPCRPPWRSSPSCRRRR